MIIGLQNVHPLQNNVSLRRPWKQKEVSRVRKINGTFRKRRKDNKINIKKNSLKSRASNCPNATKENLTIWCKGGKHISQVHIIPNLG